jgi:cytochrome c biogenesis protein CcdA/thiol-disulfide isomerase/thioredoxin
LAGILTVLAPCVLPLLPVIVGGSLSGDLHDRRRPIVIVGSLAASLVVFTLALKATTLLIRVPPGALNLLSGGIIVAIGAAMLFPVGYARMVAMTGIEARAQSLLGRGEKDRGHLAGPVLIGLALGPIFSSCSPVYAYILATVLPANFGLAMAYLAAYVLGLAAVLLAIAYFGQRVTARLRPLSNPSGWFQRSLAIIFVLVGLAVITGFGTKIQVFVDANSPLQVDRFVAGLLPGSKHPGSADSSKLYNIEPYPAPELTGIQGWVNTRPLTLAQLRGKVVLVDFWTYTCINCIRGLPYVEGWYGHYQKDGLVVIGVEAPEFSYEKVPANVAAAVKQDGLTYPVAIDGDLATWAAYQNQYWPAEYLIDRSGNVRRQSFGEGDYDQTEQAIRGLLAEDGMAKLGGNLVVPGQVAVPITNAQTPETYLGTDRANAYAGTPALGAKPDDNYRFADALAPNTWSLSGQWRVSGSQITAGNDAKIEISVAAKNVYVVGGAPAPAHVTVKWNGAGIRAGDAGADVKSGAVAIQMPNLYRIASFGKFTTGVLELDVPSGVSLNTFTFGS